MEERKKYPIGPEHYTTFEEVGNGGSASVYRAQCNSLNEIVAIKILDFERHNCDVNNVSREAQTMVLVDHPNILKSHCSFVSDHNLWVVMPYMAGGSCSHILKAAHPDGFEEVVIATILREALKGLDYLHQHGHIHRDVKAGNILIDSRGGIKLGDFGVSAYLFDSGDRQRIRNTFVGTPCWMAPEVMEQLHGYDFKADIWSFGITALELAHGHAPFSKYPPMKVLLMTLQNAPPGLDYERDQKFSKSFRHMIASCLVKDPSKRPSAKKLLKHSFFKQARSNDYIARTLLKGLPPLGDLLQELKRREEDMVAQKKMPDGEKEEISQNEYKRGISGWHFNLDDMKAQASLIQDDDLTSEKDEGIQTKQAELGTSSSRHNENFQHQLSFASRNSDNADSDENGPSVASADSLFIVPRCSRGDDNAGLPDAIPEHAILSPVNENRVDIVRKKPQELTVMSSNQSKYNDRGNPGMENSKSQNQSEIFSGAGLANPQSPDIVQPEVVQSKSTKSSVNGDDGEDKNKSPAVQRRGRFKVTSESVDMVDPALILRSSTLQLSENLVSKVIAQLPASVAPLSEDATSSDNSGLGSFLNLQLMLYANIIQRDFLIALMKQTSSNDPSDWTHASMERVEKTLLEAANEREKDLLREVSDLQLRLICAQEEIKKYKTDNGRANS